MTKKVIIPVLALGILIMTMPVFAFTQEEKEIYSSAIDSAFDGHPEAVFLQTDFNNDGIPELLIDYYPLSSYAEGTEIEVFTIVNGECVSAGSISIAHSSFYDAESGEGLYAVSGIQGVETKLELHMYDNELSYTESQREIGDTPYYSNDNPVYMKPVSHFYDEQIVPVSNSTYLTVNDLSFLDRTGLELAKNEIYARHGRMFVTPYIDKYFRQQSWYAPTIVPEEFSDSVFNEFESANIQLMVNEEARRDQGYSMEENPSSEFTNDELAEMALNCAGREFSFEAWIMEDTGDMVGILVGTPSPDGTGPTPHAYYYVNRAGVGEDTISGEYVDLSGYQ